MGLPMENDLLATTSGQIMETESKFGTQKNLLSLTFQSINILLINHDICHMNWWWVKKKGQAVSLFIHINKFLSPHVWDDLSIALQ